MVIALIAGRRERADAETINAFGTPTVVHFGGALTLSAVMSAPWPSLGAASVVLGLCGVGGLAYTAVVFRRARRQKGYTPVVEDWLWYVIFPCAVHAALTVAALLLRAATEAALFVVGRGPRAAADRRPELLGYGDARRRHRARGDEAEPG